MSTKQVTIQQAAHKSGLIDTTPEWEFARLRLVRCSACGISLIGRSVSDHIAEHDPEDFGLSPIGERRQGGQR